MEQQPEVLNKAESLFRRHHAYIVPFVLLLIGNVMYAAGGFVAGATAFVPQLIALEYYRRNRS